MLFLFSFIYFCPSFGWYGHIFARCDIVKTRYLSIIIRACLYALKYCKFIVALYFLFISSFCGSHVLSAFFGDIKSFFKKKKNIIFFLSVLYTWMGICSATLIPFTSDWTSCPQWRPRHFVVLWSWRYICLAVPYRRLFIWNENSNYI